MKKLKQAWLWLFGGEIKTTELGSPMIVKYKNPTDTMLNCILFGYNDYCISHNYGSDTDVIKTNVQGGTYGRIINQSSSKPFTIGKIRVDSENELNLKKKIKFHHVMASGIEYTEPISLLNLKSIYQYQTYIVEFSCNKQINGETYFSFEIEPNSDVTYSIYPEYIRTKIVYSIFFKINWYRKKYMSELKSWYYTKILKQLGKKIKI